MAKKFLCFWAWWFLLAGGTLFAGETVSSEAVAGSVEEQVERDFNLARLAELESWRANGGAAEGSGITAGYDAKKGFFLRDADDDFLLRISGRTQIRYVYKARAKRGSTVDPGETDKHDKSFVDLERVRLKFQGHVLNPKLTYYVQFDGDTDGSGDVETIDAYTRYKHSDELNIGVGQYKAHFLRQEKTSSSKLQLVDRSLATEFFNVDRVLGAWIDGAAGPVFYAVGVNNGFDSVNESNASVDQIPGVTAKVDFHLLGANQKGKYSENAIKGDQLLVVGGSFAYDGDNQTADAAGSLDYDVFQFGIDAEFKQGPFSLRAEYMGRWLDYESGTNADTSSKSNFPGRADAMYSHGWYVQGGVFVIEKKIEIVGRVSAVYGNEGPNDGTAVAAGPGLNWFISQSHRVKWQTDLIFFDVPASVPLQTERLSGSTGSGSFSSSTAELASGEQGAMLRTQLQLSF